MRSVLAALLAGFTCLDATPSAGQTAPNAGGDLMSEPIVLRPGDVIRVSVWPSSELGGDFTVEPSGLVYLPFLGGTQVAGLSVDKLRTQLYEGFSEATQNPVVNVFVLFQVGVLGEVRRPGIYQVNPTNTLIDVIGMAGGFDTTADQKKVRIVRESGVVEVDTYRTLEDGRGLDALSLRSGDQIVVPARGGGFNWRTLLSVFQTAATVGLMVDRITR